MSGKDNRLMPTISSAAPGPLYQQIIDGLKRDISEGRLPAGAPLPSFRQLAEELMVSLITVKRAYLELEREGVIVTRQGKGSVVADTPALPDRLLEQQLTEQLDALVRQATLMGLSAEALQDRLGEALRRAQEEGL